MHTKVAANRHASLCPCFVHDVLVSRLNVAVRFCHGSDNDAPHTYFRGPLLSFLHRDRKVDEWTHLKPGHYRMYMLPDLQRVAAKVKSTQSKVARGLDAEDLRVLGAEQNESFRNVSQLPAPCHI